MKSPLFRFGANLDDLPPITGGEGDRTRGAYRRARGWRHRVTEDQVRGAVRVFKAGGGIIKALPDEVVLPSRMVGWMYGIYEMYETTFWEGTP